MAEAFEIFDRRLLRARRAEAAPRMGEAGFLHREVAERLVERLGDINRAFANALVFGWPADGPALPVERAVYADPAAARLGGLAGPGIAAEEDALPVGDGSLSLIVSNLTLHWVNDLPGALIQMNRALEPDGLLLAAMPAGDTLIELRRCLMDAELEIAGGVGVRVSPMAELADLGGLLQRARFAMPVADSDRITISYSDPFALMRELKAMGEANAARERAKTLSRRDVLLRASQLYTERYAGGDGRVPATIELGFLTGWAPAPGQPRPKPRGSAQARLADALGSEEIQVPGSREP